MSEVESRKPKPEHCRWCDIPNPDDEHWKWEKDSRYKHGGKWRCREYVKHHARRYMSRLRADPQRRSVHEAARKDHYNKNPEYLRYKACKYADAKRGLPGIPLTWDEAKPIMLSPCSYCGVERAGGLDRIDNSLGHSSGNCVAACAQCNLVLLDMPYELKVLFVPALKEARERGLLVSWKHPRLRNLGPRDARESPARHNTSH